VLIFDSIRKSFEIEKVDVYLSVIFRRNTANENYSPILEEYLLVTSSYDSNKFGGTNA
jgi:hypothetical protein